MSQVVALWRINEWFKELKPDQLILLHGYFQDLCKWTPKVNLISAASLKEADRIHVADSILGIQGFQSEIPAGERVWDLGSGNGFPGVVLSILRPDLEVICLDSDERKAGFLKQVGLKLNIKTLSVKCIRLEKCQEQTIKFAVTRGLGEVGKLLKLCDPLFVPRGTIFHFKGSEWGRELEDIPKTFKETWKTELLTRYDLPGDGENPIRCILKSQKY